VEKRQFEKAPNLFSIPPGAPFLKTFVEALYNGEIVDGFYPRADDPLALSTVQIYVPTRRAARALRSTLVEHSLVSSSFLPKIRPLGDVDDDEFFFAIGDDQRLILEQPIEPIERLLLLARLIKPWRENLPSHIRVMFGTDNVAIPASTADAIWLASDLAALMDEIDTEEADWANLDEMMPDDVAEWWQVTLDFLKIIGQNWPNIMRERFLVSPAQWRNSALKRQRELLERQPNPTPIIALGSTGSIPATAALLKAIAHLPKGAVVFPGLDRDLDEQSWNKLQTINNDAVAFAHPQFGLYKLLKAIGAERASVKGLGFLNETKRKRELIVSEALRPAETTDRWLAIERTGLEAAMENVCLIEAANEREEALAVAIALRQAIEDPQKTAALVTNDRNLARRVSAELRRFGIVANDSGGEPLTQTPQVALIRLMLSCIFKPGDPVAFLALLKHPLAHLSMKRQKLRQRVEQFELLVLRGGTGRINISECCQFVEARIKHWTDGAVDARKDLSDELLTEFRDLAHRIVDAITPLIELSGMSNLTICQASEATIACFENIGRDDNKSLAALYESEIGQTFIVVMRSLLTDQSGLTFRPDEWPQIFDALLARATIKPKPGGHPRLTIWGALESRLQTVDTIVIGGGNEGSLPPISSNDPFMSRPMKATISLAPPELRVGLAAHDFQMAMGMDNVILSRDAMRKRGQVYSHLARMIDQRDDRPFVGQPNPVPPLELRPNHFSVTEIETLRRDPYAIYAKKILHLKPLEPFIRDPSVAERGTLYHEIVARFVLQKIDPKSPFALNELMNIAHEAFAAIGLPIDVEATWWPRFSVLAKSYLKFEANLSPRQKFAEIRAQSIEVGKTGVTLSARADRIDRISDTMADILDFKTGSTPSKKQARTLLAPQLALEGALLMRGAFADCGALTPNELSYVRLKAAGIVEYENILDKSTSASALSQQAWERLEELITYYKNPYQGYLSRALPPMTRYKGDYDHLARVLEWSSGPGDEADFDE